MKLYILRQKTNSQKKSDLTVRPRIKSRIKKAEIPHTSISIKIRSTVCSSKSIANSSAHSYSEDEMMQSGDNSRHTPASRRQEQLQANEQKEVASYICYISNPCNIILRLILLLSVLPHTIIIPLHYHLAPEEYYLLQVMYSFQWENKDKVIIDEKAHLVFFFNLKL